MASLLNGLVKFHHEEDIRSDLPADLFCAECAAFLSLERWTPERGTDKMSSRSSYCFHSDIMSLNQQSGVGCHLCMLILRVIADTYPTEDKATLVFLFMKGMNILVQVGINKARHTPFLTLHNDVQGSYATLSTSDWIYAHRRRLYRLTSTRCALDQIKKWIEICNQNHVLCSLAATGVRARKLPTRLLHIDDQKVTVVNTSTFVSRPTYMTLSHRWPKSPGIRLLKGNEAKFRAGLLQSVLPVLFRDACWLTSSLNVQYLWIDALCIIQDDKDDWEREAALMTDAYAGSFLNIVAGMSQQHRSLFFDRNPVLLSPCMIQGSKLGKKFGSEAIFTNASEAGQIARMETESRAWVLQECELAPKMVYFGENEVIWECSSVVQSESSVRGIDGPNRTPEDARNVRAKLSKFKSDHVQLTEARCVSIWEGLVSKYTSLDITYAEDRLVAISGLSQHLEDSVDGKLGRYCAGLWETGFERQLLWQIWPDIRLQGATSYLAPSWSWASHSSRIRYVGAPGGARSMSSFLEQLQVEVLPSSSVAAHGKVKSGSFTTLASICEIHHQFDVHQQQHYFQIDFMEQVSRTMHRAWLPIAFMMDDLTQAFQKLHTFMFLPLLCYDLNDHGLQYCQRPILRRLFTEWRLDGSEDSSFPILPRGRWRLPLEQEDHYALRALILAPVSGQKGHYRRVGVAEFEDLDAIRLVQEACKQMILVPDRYIERIDTRHGYKIKVV